jgi:Domain of unknown function (DUF4920)
MRAVLFTTALFTLSLTACVASPPDPSGASASASANPQGGPRPAQTSAAAVKPLDKTKFGDAISETTTTPLPAIVKDSSQFANKTVRTEGTVSAVCQSMGCWMQIADTSGKAHIKMAGHSFFVPKESSGHRAIVQGKVIGTDQPNSCGSDGCGNQAVTQVQIEATGIEFID